MLDKLFPFNDALHRDASRAGGGVTGKGVACLRTAIGGPKHLSHLAAVDRRAERNVAPGQALGDWHDVRDHTIVFKGPERSAPSAAAHHLIGDQQDAVAVTNIAHAPGLARRRRHDAAGRADDRLEDKSGNI